MKQHTLPTAPRAHQLPPKWDGCTVEWGEWRRTDLGGVTWDLDDTDYGDDGSYS